jgi:hypothetical protein
MPTSKNNEFLNQFNDLSYDRTETVANNEYNTSTGIDASLKRALELGGGFSTIDSDMNYNIINGANFKHNNMVHFNSSRGQSTNNSKIYETKLGIHTGNDKNWKHKKETPVLFQPMKQNIFGMQSYTNKIKNRYMPSMYKNGDQLPNSKKLIAKGLNGKKQEGLYNTSRIMPKNINQLRTLTNQRITYKGEIIESGLKGNKRSANIKLSKFKKKDFREQKTSDFAKPKLTQIKRTIHGKTTRKKVKTLSTQCYSGPASHSVHRNLSASHLEPTPPAKTSYSYEITNAKDNNNRIINNKRSFRNKEAARAEQENKYGGMITTNNNLYNNNYTPLQETLKEQTNYQYDGNVTLNKNMYNNNYINPNETLKEQTNYQYDGNLNTNTLNNYNNTFDQPEETLKEQTSYQYDGNLNTTKINNYNNTFDRPEETLKEQTSYQYDGNLNTTKINNYNNTFDQPEETLKEQTSYQYDGNLNTTKINNYNNTFDQPDETLKEQILFSRDGSINNQNNIYNNSFDRPEQPLKEQTLYSNNGSINNKDYTYTRDMNMRARTTLKQTTLSSYEGNVAEDSGVYFKNNDNARPTIRQSTLINNYTSGLNNNSRGASYDSMKKFKPLTKLGLKETVLESYNEGDSNKNMIGASRNNIGTIQSLKNDLNGKIKTNGFKNLGTTTRLPTFATMLENDDQEVHQKKHFINYNPNIQQTLQKNPLINNVTFRSIVN